MRVIVILLYSFISFSVFGQTQHDSLVWSDEFDYVGSPDETKWGYDLGRGCELPCGCGWGNNELQSYTRNQAEVKDGCLNINLIPSENTKGLYESARLVTRGIESWKYGTFEFKAKPAKGLGTWSAIWMLPEENRYGGWPKSGEIDIMEHVGFAEDSIVASIHTESYNHMIHSHKNASLFVSDATDEFHIYKLVWTEDKLSYLIDGDLYFEFKKEADESEVWPYDQSFYLIFNLAFGGNWGGLKGVDSEIKNASLTIDYVRIYQ